MNAASDLVDLIDDIGQTRRAMNALVDLMMPQRRDNQDDLAHVDRSELALLLAALNGQFARDIAAARELSLGMAPSPSERHRRF